MDAEIRAKIRELMASGALPSELPSFERRGSLQNRAQKGSFGGRSAGIGDFGKCTLHLGEREAGLRFCGKCLACDRSFVASPAIDFA